MSKFYIKVTEEVPSDASPLEILMNRKPQYYYKERLNIEVDSDPTVKVSQLVAASPTEGGDIK